jgi:hypothetical protein
MCLDRGKEIRMLGLQATTTRLRFHAGGAAQDLTEVNINLTAVIQAGGWKSTRMVAMISTVD